MLPLSRRLLHCSSLFRTQFRTISSQKKASIINIGLPYTDERVARGGVDPLKVKEGIEETIRLMGEAGWVKGEGFVSVMASDRTGLEEFVEALKEWKRDALFLGGGLREGAGFDEFRGEVIKTAKEITPDIKIVQVSLMKGPQSIVEAAEEVEKGLGES